MSDPALHHSSTTRLSDLIASRELSSRELLDHFVDRIESLNPRVNAVVTLDIDRARDSAAVADAATAAGLSSGPLHGIPITIKDALAVAGMRSTGGAVELRDHIAERDADVVAAVRGAGAIPFGKTNAPRWSGDLQTFNEIFGTTNNPWDDTRVPGGSSGGAAASVAMGFTAFELGTDIGGSIRVPAAYCGIVGHKPSFGLVPCGGYIDRIDYGTTEPDINVHGPLARSVDDLELLLDIIAAPRPDRARAVRHVVPDARHDRIDDCRIAVWSDTSDCPASAATVAAVEHAGDVLASMGANVDRSRRPDLDANAASLLGGFLISVATSPSLTNDEFAFYRSLAADENASEMVRVGIGPYVVSHREWLAADVARSHIRARWREFFGDVDALICPVIVTPPFPHTQDGNLLDREIVVDGRRRPYIDLLWWTMLIGMAYLPVTTVPVSVTDDGLPVAVQVVGPYMEDRTALSIASSLRDELGPMSFPG